jgi:hypothetical protein
MEDKHGHDLPSEAQQMTDPMGQVPNSVLNEELVKSTSTASKDDSGNSKTSDSNVEDPTPTLEKGDSEEGIVYFRSFPCTGGCDRVELLCRDMHYFLKCASTSRFLSKFYLHGIVSQTCLGNS